MSEECTCALAQMRKERNSWYNKYCELLIEYNNLQNSLSNEQHKKGDFNARKQ